MSSKDEDRPVEFYGDEIPYLKKTKYSGKLIVVEGPDGSGRSTQIEILKARLESQGHSVITTGLKRSTLIGEGILAAKQNLPMGQMTLALFYAADFADRLEHLIIPSLEAGSIVIADRYIFTLMARSNVRRISRKWSKDLLGFAIKPDLMFYLDVEPIELFHRIFQKYGGPEYYESGADMGMGKDLFDSFVIYQRKMADEFRKMEGTYGLVPINANRTVEEVNNELWEKISFFL